MTQDTLESIWSMYRPDVAAFTRIALLVGHSQAAIDEFLDEPAEGDREDDEE